MASKPKPTAMTSSDDRTVKAAQAVLRGKSKKGRFASLLPFLGPAFIASVAYVDPGNFATNIAGGAEFGYTLLWVIVASNLMAILIQTLSAKLGIATGLNLAEQCRKHFRPGFVKFLWVLMELVAMATDLAEFLGAAIGFNLLLHIPLWLAGILTGITTFLILGLERKGFRPLEAVISAMVGVVAVSYVIETIIDKPDWGNVLYHAVVPTLKGPESVILATGILGATVMPHAIFLHSALMQGRVKVKKPAQLKRLFRFELADVLIAMSVASLINGAMLIMAASAFHSQGLTNVGSIQEAYKTLEPLLGKAAQSVFAISLLASGLSSASVGTMAGQVIMQGFLHLDIPVWIRRLVTMVPSMIVIAIGLDPSRTLVISQVLLSFGLPFAIIPLVIFTSQKKIMGALVNHKITTILASGVAGLIVVLNIYLLYTTFTGG
ncbi:NRAMP (natural resistance-associated macrophage protein) metal ion transporter [Longilinea arvoryzae]|uniref:Divalent metal cation transporter MntH n=1 Tax=Longilinea arvoryzae TaxID=360412 RepID=A0A0S7B8K9_9CHLR|nr:Nramp family divalent metal transporter [Longilinea arvoryzae]GAP13687.1 NRAMP (natural resistance-associated macrophage protein) metal ion transporter [Longilinea arvoryzae]